MSDATIGSRKRVGQAITLVLDVADELGISYEAALSFFSADDWRGIQEGSYKGISEAAVRHALRLSASSSDTWPSAGRHQ